MSPVTEVKCIKCENSSAVDTAGEMFSRNHKVQDARTRKAWNPYCKACLKVRYQENRGRYLEKNKARYQAKRELYLEQKKKYGQEQRAKILEYKKKYYAEQNGKERSRASYAKHKDSILKRNAERRLLSAKSRETVEHRRWVQSLSETDRFLYDTMKAWQQGARQRDLEFSVSFQDIIHLLVRQAGKCAYSGWEMKLEVNSPLKISMDRIDSSKPYTLDNIVLCCTVFNLMKLDYSLEEFLEYCKAVVDAQTPGT